MIEIHTLGWREDHALEDGEDPNVHLYCRVFIDGHEIPGVTRARTRHDNDFAITTITTYEPAKIITHSKDSWNELGKPRPVRDLLDPRDQ